MNTYLAAAIRYAELGYRVFPCVPGTSKPLTERGFYDATTNAEQIEYWWTRYPLANVAIAAEGLLVVDIDPFKGGHPNLWPGDPEQAADLAGAGAVAVTPRGGKHYYFKRPIGKKWGCTTSRLALHVDTRTNGGYAIAPPSQRPDGTYSWAPDLELTVPPDCLPEPPGWLVDALDRLASSSNGKAKASAGGEQAEASAEPGTIPDGIRNDSLFRIGCNLRRNNLTESQIADVLWQINVAACKPPLEEKEVRRIAQSAAEYKPAVVADIVDEVETTSTPDPGLIPDELLRVPGFIDEVMKYTLDTAPYPEPVLAFAGALALQALLAGRKVRDAMDSRTNLYILSLANSGVGKDHARKVNAKILYEVGLADCLGTSFASGEGIEDRLFIQPATLFQVDEFDGLLLRVSQAKDARHEQIVSILLQMYSAAASIYVMRAKAGHERTAIDQPCLCLFGTAVPKNFYESLSERLMTNGFLARLVILESRGRGGGRDATELPIPATILDTARWWAEFKPGSGGNLANWHPVPYNAPQTAEAETVFRSIRERADAEYNKCEQANDPAGMAIWARAYEKARRLALIYACSTDREKPIITVDAATWAGNFVEHQTRRMLCMANRYASESEFDAKRKRLLEVLDQWRRQHGEEWMPFWKVSRVLPWSKREHEEVRNTLIEQRLIESQILVTGRRGRPGLCYRLVGPKKSQEN